MTIETFEIIGTLFFTAVGIFMFVVMPKIDWEKFWDKYIKITLD